MNLFLWQYFCEGLRFSWFGWWHYFAILQNNWMDINSISEDARHNVKKISESVHWILIVSKKKFFLHEFYTFIAHAKQLKIHLTPMYIYIFLHLACAVYCLYVCFVFLLCMLLLMHHWQYCRPINHYHTRTNNMTKRRYNVSSI